MRSKRFDRSWRLLGVVAILIILACFLLFSLPIKKEWQGPNSGIWYCEDLQLQLCFQPNIEYIDRETGQVDSRSYALVGGKLIMCEVYEHKGTYSLCVINQDISNTEKLNDTIFEGEFVSLDEREYIVRSNNGKFFTFKKIGEFSLDKKLEYYRKQIDEYTGMRAVGKTQHIAIAMQKAKDLWKTELGINVIDEDVQVEIDFVNSCWLVSVSCENSPVALIDTMGNVIGVFYR